MSFKFSGNASAGVRPRQQECVCGHSLTDHGSTGDCDCRFMSPKLYQAPGGTTQLSLLTACDCSHYQENT